MSLIYSIPFPRSRKESFSRQGVHPIVLPAWSLSANTNGGKEGYSSFQHPKVSLNHKSTFFLLSGGRNHLHEVFPQWCEAEGRNTSGTVRERAAPPPWREMKCVVEVLLTDIRCAQLFLFTSPPLINYPCSKFRPTLTMFNKVLRFLELSFLLI